MTKEQIIEQYPIALAEKEGKKIQYFSTSTNKWTNCPGHAIYGSEKLRIKPESVKRLPTIEEVEKWFLENKVFKLKTQIHGLYRMETISVEKQSLRIGGTIICIKELCEDFTNYDGTELYITE